MNIFLLGKLKFVVIFNFWKFYMHVSKIIKLYPLNMCSYLYINCSSVMSSKTFTLVCFLLTLRLSCIVLTSPVWKFLRLLLILHVRRLWFGSHITLNYLYQMNLTIANPVSDIYIYGEREVLTGEGNGNPLQ